MRIDKFLWCVRIFKTRSIATDACKGGKVSVNDLPAKPSREVKVGDTISIRFPWFVKTIEVLSLPTSRVGAALVSQFVVDKTPPEEYARRDEIRRQQQLAPFRPPGLGRPTKKERRTLEKFLKKRT